MNTIIGDGRLEMGGQLRPYYIGTRQTALFCELQGAGFDLQDYDRLLLEVGINQHLAAKAAAEGTAFTPTGRKALTPAENRDFLYSALFAGAKREDLPRDFTADDVADWIDAADLNEVMKPFVTQYGLLAQQLERIQNRPGNAPAPALTANRGGKTASQPKPKK